MTKLISIIAIIAIVVNLTSCDKVENPVVVKFDDGLDWALFPDGDSATYNWPVWTNNSNTLKNVLLEDFTGHTCTNCPAAGAIAVQLENDNPGRVFVASIHASPDGGFQAVSPPEFLNDFTTEAGTAYCNEIDGFFGNPAGMVNRNSNGFIGSNWHFSSTWATQTTNTLAETLDANLQVQYNYFPATNGLFVHTESEILNDLTGTYNLIMYLVRDVVEGPQKLDNGSTDEEYHHHAVLTDNLNGTWGSQIVSGTATAGDKYYNDFTYQVPTTDTTFNIDNLSVITYLCNRETFEVLQVIKTELQ